MITADTVFLVMDDADALRTINSRPLHLLAQNSRPFLNKINLSTELYKSETRRLELHASEMTESLQPHAEARNDCLTLDVDNHADLTRLLIGFPRAQGGQGPWAEC
ncbi:MULTISPECIES: hypothetical protein [unclassified Pseudomonas]|uniref:hypothetical protein n=1 Tax=unclassified Pseudomonas TaxID=196821 RepID=UPI000BA441F5|nr:MULTISPECIES: hypothetical protein [unclassified Pseudomonas]